MTKLSISSNLSKLILTLYTLIIVCIGFATVIEKYRGTAFVGEHIYGAWWFSALWAALTVAALAYFVRQRLYRRLALLLLHASFVVILAGALTTHLFARSGTVSLRVGDTVDVPVKMTLKEFRVINYPGTDTPLDYQSVICKGQGGGSFLISMNNVANIDGYRLFQQSCDSDGQGVTLGYRYDPYGIAITYTGYLMLLLGIIATLFSRHTQMRSLYRKAMTVALLLFCVNATADDRLPVVDKDIAHRMGTIHVLYAGRICPLNTVATDFTMKMTGSASWHGYSADQVFFSWMIYYMPWEKELCRPNRPTPQPLPEGRGADTPSDERSAVLEMFYSGQFTKIFPYRLNRPTTNRPTPQPLPAGRGVDTSSVNFSSAETSASETSALEGNYSPPCREGQGGGSVGSTGSVAWYSPGSQVLPREIPVKEQFFIKQSMDFLTEAIVTGQRERAFEIIAKIKLFQRDMIGDVLPSERKTQAEIFYNRLRSIKFPVLITAQLGLRWWLSGHIPLSNGYETMLFMAWVLLVLTVVLFRRVRIILVIGPLAALCCLLVAMMAGSGSEITPLMPVLQSPLLSVHVMTVMCAYALFAIQMLLGLYALFLIRRSSQPNSSLFTLHSSLKREAQPNYPLSIINFQLERASALSQFLLYPAVFLLTVGIFLGAVWANVSWGNYWSWDPKESWALITLMVYAVPLHRSPLTTRRSPLAYHVYMVGAFLAVLITYFGVNFLLGGMHSYA